MGFSDKVQILKCDGRREVQGRRLRVADDYREGSNEIQYGKEQAIAQTETVRRVEEANHNVQGSTRPNGPCLPLELPGKAKRASGL